MAKSTAKKAGIALIIIGILALGFVIMRSGAVSGLDGFGGLFDFGGNKVVCSATVHNPLVYPVLGNLEISSHECHLEECTALFSVWTWTGYSDKGSIALFVNGDQQDESTFVIDETQERTFDLKGSCLGKTETQNIQLKVFDDRGEQIRVVEERLEP